MNLNRKIECEVLENNIIQLPDDIVKELSLKQGSSVEIEWDMKAKEKCLVIQEGEDNVKSEEYYCIPKWLFEKCGIPLNSVQIIHESGQIMITSSDKIIESLGAELIASLYEQDVNFSLLADDLVDYINEGLQDESSV